MAASIAVLVGASLLGACSPSTADVQSADNQSDMAQSESDAQAESGDFGPLVLYSGRKEKLVGPLIEQFTADTGIEVDVRYAGTSELAAQLIEEGEKSPAQVFLSQDAGALGAIAEAQMFSTLPQEITSKVPANYTSRDGSWVSITGRARVVAYDSEKYTADQVPDDVFALTDPQWKGKVAIAPTNASFQSFVTAMRVSEGEEKTEQWLKDLVANDAQIFSKNGEILDAVNAGTVDLGLINHYYWARSEQDPTTLRAQLKFGKPGSVSALVNVTGVGILKNAENNPNAKAFVDYMLSEKGQQYFLNKTFEYPLVEGVGSPANVPPMDKLGGPDIDLAELSSLSQTVDMLTRVGLI